MRILVAVDGSDQSYDAVRALEYVSPRREVILLHVLDVPKSAFPMMTPEITQELYATVESGMKEDGERLLERIVSILPLHTGPTSKRIEVGKPAQAILAAAKRERADLIVLGSRGLGLVHEVLLGSVSHRVITQAPCPTMVVCRHMRALSKILLAIEDEKDEGAAMTFLEAKPFKETPEVTVLTILPWAAPLWPAGISESEALKEQAIKSAGEFVDGVAVKLSKLGYRASGAVTLGDPGHAILGWAGETKPDLIIMGSRGRRGATRFLLGSASHTVLHRAPCPVLVLR